MPDPVSPTTGWGVVHLFCRPAGEVDRAAVHKAVDAMAADDHQVVTVATLGHKADLVLMALGPDLWRLRRFQTELEAAGLEVVDSYVSLTELSEYAAGRPRGAPAGPAVPAAPARGQAGVLLLPDVEAPRRRARTGSRCPTTSARS